MRITVNSQAHRWSRVLPGDFSFTKLSPDCFWFSLALIMKPSKSGTKQALSPPPNGFLPQCSICGGDGILLGKLALRKYFRCRLCGMTWSFVRESRRKG